MQPRIVLVSILLITTALSGCIGDEHNSHNFNGLEYEPASTAPDFTLTDQNGETVSLSDFHGKVVVLAFPYTACPDVCLTIEANLHYINEQMSDEEDLVILSITIDPARDTSAHLWGWTNVRGYDWPHLTSSNHSELAEVWDKYHLRVDSEHINSDHSDHDDHGDHDDHSDHSDMSHQVAVLYPDNTTELYDGDHDMLPTENATGWNLTESTMSMNNISLNYSVHEQYGHSVTGINGIDSPSDSSWWWSLYIWNDSNSTWETSDVGIDEVMVMHDTDHIAWAASNANISLLPTPDNHIGGHEEHDDHSDMDGDNHEMYEVGHNTVTFVIDKDGNKRLVYTGLSWSNDELMEDLEYLLNSDSGAEHTSDGHDDHDH